MKKKLSNSLGSLVWLCAAAVFYATVAGAQTTSAGLFNAVVNPEDQGGNSFSNGEYDLLRGFVLDSQRNADTCSAPGVFDGSTCSNAILLRMVNPAISGDKFSYEIHVKASAPAGVSDRAEIGDPATENNRDSLGNVYGGSVIGVSKRIDELTDCTVEGGDLLEGSGISIALTTQGVGPTRGSWFSIGNNIIGPASPTAERFKVIPSGEEEYIQMYTVECTNSGSAGDLAEVAFSGGHQPEFLQLTEGGQFAGVFEQYTSFAVNDLLNFPLSGSGYYLADAEFSGDNEKVYVYLGRTDSSVLLPSNLSDASLVMTSSGNVTYALENSISLGNDELGRAVYLLDVVPQGDASSVTMAVSDNLDNDVTDAAAYAYTIAAGGSSDLNNLTPADQTRTLYPHHPDKPYVTGITVAANSVDVEVNFSDPIATNQDGTGDLVADDFDVMLYGLSTQLGSVSGINKVGNTYRLTMTWDNSSTGIVGVNDRIEVRLAERSEDLGYKSLKTVYIDTAETSTYSAQRQGVYALQGATDLLRFYTVRFSPNEVTESPDTDTSIEVFVGRTGDSSGVLAYSNIAISCGGETGTLDSLLSRDNLLSSVDVPNGQNEVSAGTLTLGNDEDSSGPPSVTCQITADIDGTSQTIYNNILTLNNDDTNAPVSIHPPTGNVSFLESDGGALLNNSVELNDPDAGSEIPEDDVVVTVKLVIDGRVKNNLGLIATGYTRSETLMTPSTPAGDRLSASDAQAWLRTVEVVSVDGKVPPARARVIITVLSFAAGADSSFGNPSASTYAVSVQKASRIDQGLVADDLEADIGITEATTPANTAEEIRAAVAMYCDDGYYGDGDDDGVPNNVEVAIGTDCTLYDNRDFVGAGRPAITLSSSPNQTPAYSIAPDSLEDLKVSCYDPDNEDGSCPIVVAYFVADGGVCTETDGIGGTFESDCETVFYSEGSRNSYSASPGKVKVVWLGLGSDGDWAHTSTELTSVIEFESAEYYLAPIAFVQFDDPRASANGWVYPSGTAGATPQLVLPPTYEDALVPPMLTILAIDPITRDQARNGVIVNGEMVPFNLGDTAVQVRFDSHFTGIGRSIADVETWILEERDWLYSSLSNNHSSLTASVLDDAATAELNKKVSVTLQCGDQEASIIERSSARNCSLSFSDNVTHWGYYVKAYSTTDSLIVAPPVGLGEFQLGGTADPILSVSENNMVGELPTTPLEQGYVLEVMHVVAAIKDDAGATMDQRGASFPITAVAHNASDMDLDGLVDDGTIGNEEQFVARETNSSVTNAFLFVSSDIGGSNGRITIGPHAFSDGFNYDSGTDLSKTKEGDPLVSNALDLVEHIAIAGIGVFDFYMQSDVAFDDQPARVVIPLREGLPSGGGTYWIYDGENWNRHSSVYSASQPCPPVPPPGPVGAGSGWSNGLTEGDSCLLVELTDDCSTNEGGASGSGDTTSGCGVISDIATITETSTGMETITPPPSRRSGGGGGSADWLLLSGLLLAALISSARLVRRRVQ